MELEEMKQLWQQQQQAIEQSKQTNEQLLRRLIDSKAGGSLGRILGMEYLSLSLCVLILVVLVLNAGTLPFTTEMSIAYPVCIAATVLGVAWGIYKIRVFQKVDIVRQPVKHNMELITRIRMFFHYEFRSSVILVPILVPALLCVVFYLVHHQSVMEQGNMFLRASVLASVVTFVVLYFIYQRIYQPLFRSLLQDLEEIREFNQP